MILGALNVSALYPGGGAVPASLPYAGSGPGGTTDLHTLEKQHILAVLGSVAGDKTQAAELLGVSPHAGAARGRMDPRLMPGSTPAQAASPASNRASPPWRRPLSNLAQWPVRRKLLLLVLLPLGVVLPLLGLILLAWGNTAVDRMLITKVRSDLAVAQGYFDRVLGEVRASAMAVANAHALHQVLAK